MRARRSAREGAGGKIEELRARAKYDGGVAAECLLSALGTTAQEDENEYLRARVGALMMVRGLAALEALAAPPKE